MAVEGKISGLHLSGDIPVKTDQVWQRSPIYIALHNNTLAMHNTTCNLATYEDDVISCRDVEKCFRVSGS